MAKQVVTTDRLARPRSPYSYGVKAGGLVFTAGIFGQDRSGNVVGSTPGRPDVEAQTDQALDNLRTVLELLGADLGRVAKVKGYIADWRGFDRYNQRYRQAFKAPYPARATVGATLLREAAMIEVEAVAAVGETPRELRSPKLPPQLPDVPGTQGGTRVGDLLFIKGHVARNLEGDFVGRGDLRAQAEQILDNIGAALGAGGATFADVLKVNGTVPDWFGFAAYNEIYNKYFREPYAARATIQGMLMREGLLLEIEAFAAVGRPRTYVESDLAGAGHFTLKRRDDTIYSPKLPPALAPHSHAVRAGDLIFVCGEVPCDETGRMVGRGDIRVQTRKTMENIRVTLEHLGCAMDDIVKANVSLAEPRHFTAFNEEYAKFFTPPYPARATVGAGLAQPGMLIEVEAIAVAGAAQNAVVVTGP
jgi:2-iminobutanoate/2-iminopropanoate deaminase